MHLRRLLSRLAAVLHLEETAISFPFSQYAAAHNTMFTATQTAQNNVGATVA